MAFNVHEIRRDFLPWRKRTRKTFDSPDSAATTQRPRQVLEARALKMLNANPQWSILSGTGHPGYEQAREITRYIKLPFYKRSDFY